jgi:IS30 family transposase
MGVYTQLTQEQRYQIYAFLKAGFSQSVIAKEIGVHKSTVSRELSRNRGQRGYRPKQANQLATSRRVLAKKHVKLSPGAIALIESLIIQDFSPEQVSGFLKRTSGLSVSHEAIYQHILKDKAHGGKLYQHLRHANKKRKKRYGSYDRRGQIIGRVSIDNRPAIVDAKKRIGDWEIDTVIGKNHKGALVTIVERQSKYTLIKRVVNKKADMVADATIDLLKPFKKRVCTITADNGKEFARHSLIAKDLKSLFFFAHPYHSWERGLNENTNGLIRQYFPKAMSFETITDDQIQFVMDQLNNRPRKTLGFKTPNEVFLGIKFKLAA